MRKTVFLLAALVMLLALAGCTTRIAQIETDDVEKVEITFLPESYEYARTYTDREKIECVVSYLNGLTLRERFPENPNECDGGAYTLILTMTDGTQREFIHFGNMFLRENGGDWLRMTYEEASALDDIIYRIPSD